MCYWIVQRQSRHDSWNTQEQNPNPLPPKSVSYTGNPEHAYMGGSTEQSGSPYPCVWRCVKLFFLPGTALQREEQLSLVDLSQKHLKKNWMWATGQASLRIWPCTTSEVPQHICGYFQGWCRTLGLAQSLPLQGEIQGTYKVMEATFLSCYTEVEGLRE